MAGYDPREHGARCEVCPLRGQVFVPPEVGTSVTAAGRARGECFAIVGEAPGDNEERTGRPFVGRSGEELDRALYAAGLDRRKALTTNVLLCRPPGNGFNDLLKRISAFNKAAESAYKEQVKQAMAASQPLPAPPELLQSPVECCKPRLDRELENFKHFITLGKTATNTVAGSKAGIHALRGGLLPVEATDRTPARKVLPTVHPAACMREPKWFHVFRADVKKAAAWFGGEDWTPPTIYRQPSPAQLRVYLERNRGQALASDIETDGIESLSAKIRCIAIGTTHDCVGMSFLSKDGFTRFYSYQDELEIRAILKEYYEDASVVKVGQNFGYYDKLVLLAQWGVQVRNIVDTMLLHRLAESEMPHGLAYIVSMYAHAPSWKTNREGNKLSTASESDEELLTYCCMDTVLTARVLRPLIEHMKRSGQEQLFGIDTAMQAICADMHTVGMWVDQDARTTKERELLARRHALLTEIRQQLGKPDFNPGSVQQLREVLFEEWGLVADLDDKERLTDNNDPSTSDLVLRTFLSDSSVTGHHRAVIKLIRYYRKVMKVLGTYVTKMRPSDVEAEDELGWDDDDEWVDRETRRLYGLKKMGIVNPVTGRMYPGYNSAVAVTGRLSSSKPINAQNYPKVLRALVRAAPGHILVGADMDQVELRIAAARWGVQLYLRAFAEGKDPHSMTAFAVFGLEFCKAAGIDPACFERPGKLVGASYDAKGKFIGTGDAEKMRTLSKAVQYASQYQALVETVAQLIRKTEVPARNPDGTERSDGTTDLPFATMKLRRVREMRDNWLKGAPEFESGWAAEIAHFKKHGYVQEYVTGRKRFFLDTAQATDGKGSTNDIVNFPIQASAAGLMNLALVKLHRAIPLHAWGPGTGIINQCHDSIVVECPEDGCQVYTDAETGKKKVHVPEGSIPWQVARLLEECLTQTHASLPGVTFTASADVGYTWKDV